MVGYINIFVVVSFNVINLSIASSFMQLLSIDIYSDGVTCFMIYFRLWSWKGINTICALASLQLK